MKEDLEGLRHELFNGIVAIAGCLKSVESILKNMSRALEKYDEHLKSDNEDTVK